MRVINGAKRAVGGDNLLSVAQCVPWVTPMASAGTSASKRQERFHGAFTGGFSAGFYNSVRARSLVSIASAQPVFSSYFVFLGTLPLFY